VGLERSNVCCRSALAAALALLIGFQLGLLAAAGLICWPGRRPGGAGGAHEPDRDWPLNPQGRAADLGQLLDGLAAEIFWLLLCLRW
jgi:hypothetical protein